MVFPGSSQGIEIAMKAALDGRMQHLATDFPSRPLYEISAAPDSFNPSEEQLMDNPFFREFNVGNPDVDHLEELGINMANLSSAGAASNITSSTSSISSSSTASLAASSSASSVVDTLRPTQQGSGRQNGQGEGGADSHERAQKQGRNAKAASELTHRRDYDDEDEDEDEEEDHDDGYLMATDQDNSELDPDVEDFTRELTPEELENIRKNREEDDKVRELEAKAEALEASSGNAAEGAGAGVGAGAEDDSTDDETVGFVDEQGTLFEFTDPVLEGDVDSNYKALAELELTDSDADVRDAKEPDTDGHFEDFVAMEQEQEEDDFNVSGDDDDLKRDPIFSDIDDYEDLTSDDDTAFRGPKDDLLGEGRNGGSSRGKKRGSSEFGGPDADAEADVGDLGDLSSSGESSLEDSSSSTERERGSGSEEDGNEDSEVDSEELVLYGDEEDEDMEEEDEDSDGGSDPEALAARIELAGDKETADLIRDALRGKGPRVTGSDQEGAGFSGDEGADGDDSFDDDDKDAITNLNDFIETRKDDEDSEEDNIYPSPNEPLADDTHESDVHRWPYVSVDEHIYYGNFSRDIMAVDPVRATPKRVDLVRARALADTFRPSQAFIAEEHAVSRIVKEHQDAQRAIEEAAQQKRRRGGIRRRRGPNDEV